MQTLEHGKEPHRVQPIVELTSELIRFKSMHSRPDEIQNCTAFIESYLVRHGIGFRRLDQNGVPTLLVLRPDGTAPVLLMSHIDVVDAPDALFEPRVENGRLFGRGSIDDKYAAALSLVLLAEWIERLRAAGKTQADLPFGILISGDEEIGGKNGARAALAQLRSDFAIALDGGNRKKIVVKEKGILRLKLIARGKTAHAARPWLGENAIEALIADYFALKAHFAAAAPDHWHRTLNFSRIQAGKAVNQVPDYAEALFDIRYTENDDMQRGGRGHPPGHPGRGRGGRNGTAFPERPHAAACAADRDRRPARGRLRARGERCALPLGVRHPGDRLGARRRQQRPLPGGAHQPRQPVRGAPHPGRVLPGDGFDNLAGV